MTEIVLLRCGEIKVSHVYKLQKEISRINKIGDLITLYLFFGFIVELFRYIDMREKELIIIKLIRMLFWHITILTSKI